MMMMITTTTTTTMLCVKNYFIFVISCILYGLYGEDNVNGTTDFDSTLRLIAGSLKMFKKGKVLEFLSQCLMI